MDGVRILLGLTLVLLGGCVNSTARVETQPHNLAGKEVLHVRHFPPDSHNVDKLIASELRQLGFRATSGESPPDDVDAIVTYVDKWRWDMSMYMLALAIKIRDPDTDFPIAEANSYHTSLSRKSPDDMVQEVLENIFGNANTSEINQ